MFDENKLKKVGVCFKAFQLKAIGPIVQFMYS